jgi:hypothetical protein
MKTRTSVSILIIVLAVLIITGSYVTAQDAYVVKEDEELFGTWINTDYDKMNKDAKIVIKPAGKAEYYNASTDSDAVQGEYVITDKWVDSEGNIWYKMRGEIPLYMIRYYSLYKISNSGKTLQCIFNNRDYPTEIAPEDTRYSIFYRQE